MKPSWPDCAPATSPRGSPRRALRLAVASLHLQRLAGPELAEELHQQTWLSVLDHVGEFRSGEGNTALATAGGFKAGSFRIATNKANDVWRSRGRERNAKEGLRRMLDPRAPEADAGIETVEQNHKLSPRWTCSPREQREALCCAFYSSMKFTEIAKVVGCPVNTSADPRAQGHPQARQMMEAE
jgi:DNA-directed RNA polymerase specialized sigma24 family protein